MLSSCWHGMYWVWVCVELCQSLFKIMKNARYKYEINLAVPVSNCRFHRQRFVSCTLYPLSEILKSLSFNTQAVWLSTINAWNTNWNHSCFILAIHLWYMIYLLTAIGLSHGGSSTAHIYTKTIHRTTQNKQYIEQHTEFWKRNWDIIANSFSWSAWSRYSKRYNPKKLIGLRINRRWKLDHLFY